MILNGHEVAVRWCEPFSSELGPFVKKGRNELKVEVTGTWRNRIIYDLSLPEAERIRLALLDCIDEDAAAFEPLSKAYGIPKDEPGRDETLEKCLCDAAAAPMKIMELACEAILLHKEFAEKGSTLMISDAGTGVVFCWAAMYGAALNVKVNTKLMKDRAHADEMNARVDELMDKYWKIADEVYESVYGRIC